LTAHGQEFLGYGLVTQKIALFASLFDEPKIPRHSHDLSRFLLTVADIMPELEKPPTALPHVTYPSSNKNVFSDSSLRLFSSSR